ncbi:hypothetical protein J2T60_001201 [Natronospira proteinivora]|uniref:Exo-alpha-sialidase n=1 Tax=Natronospira proteinivora TaxID=1807133 RepID=A0ABT1G7F7_9GAMM|nr:exo-alpha-sialidase [Natronospira proteinivora]MCP1727236.1 hypothetical protein [Natronospira proteinivora]
MLKLRCLAGRILVAIAAMVAVMLAAFSVHAESPSAVEWHAPIEVDSGDAHQGSWRMNRSDFRYVDDPAVAVNDDGITAVVWARQSRQDLYLQLFDEQGEALLDSPTNISRSSDTFSWLPRVVLGEGESPAVHVLWQEIVFSGGSHGGEIFYARSQNGGAEFSEPQNLSQIEAGAGKGRLDRDTWQNGSLDLVRDASGNLHAAWTEYEGRLKYARAVPDDFEFEAPRHIAGDDDRPARGPSLAVDGDSEVALAWSVGETREADIHISYSEDGSDDFSEPEKAVSGPGHADAPSIVFDGEGVLHLAYAEAAEGPGGAYAIRHTRADSPSQSFGSVSTISEPPPRDNDAQAHFPALRIDGADRLHLVWELYPEGWPRSRGLAYTRAPADGEFSPPALVEGTGDPSDGINGSLQGLFMQKLAVTADGLPVVVNSTFREDEESRIRLIRGELSDSE